MRPLFCRLNRHRPVRSHVVWDGLHYVSTCQDCGKHILRQRHRLWRTDPHPES